MARGVVQHITYVTPWLRRQFIERKLDQPLDQGRIWRVVPDTAKAAARAKLSTHTPAQLVADLASANGWTRDTAQRLSWSAAERRRIPAFEEVAASAPSPLTRFHALWTLEGLEKLDAADGRRDAGRRQPEGQRHRHPPRRAAGQKRSDARGENLRRSPSTRPPTCSSSSCLSLGEIGGAKADAITAAFSTRTWRIPLARSAAISGLRGRELEFTKGVLASPDWATESKGRETALAQLTRCVLEERKPDRVAEMLAVASQPRKAAWQQLAMLDGLSSPSKNFKPVRLTAEPAAITQAPAPELKKRAGKIASLVTWPGKPGDVPEKKAPPLTDAQKAFVEQGATVYNTVCTACHLPQGQGQEGLAPPLAGSEWVGMPEGRLIRIVLQGVAGKMEVAGKTYSLDMPGLGAALTDEQIAQVLSYTRRSFGHEEPVVETEAVEKIRAGTKDRGASWSAEELKQIH